MSSANFKTKKISGKLEASVLSVNKETELDRPLYAVNWFDLKRRWMYDLYNRLVIGRVLKIGASPIFKGVLKRSIIDNERLRRDMLLVVKYPKAESFLELISNLLFQIKGLLRSAAVKHFQFGFTKSLGMEPRISSGKYKGKLCYLVHVCEGGVDLDHQSLIAEAATHEVFPLFVGKKAALLGIKKDGAKLKSLDFILSYTFVLSGFDEQALEQFINSAFYKAYFKDCTHNFAGIYLRII